MVTASTASTRTNTELALRVIKTLMYFKAREMRVTLVSLGRLLLGTKRKDSREAWENEDREMLADILEIIHWLNRTGKVAHENGFYEWVGRDDTKRGVKISTRDRLETEEAAREKMKQASRVASVLKHVPFVRLVGICGTVAMGNVRQESDIDFFIVARQGRIWTARILLMAVLELLGARKKPRLVKDRICLNHFIVDECLESRYKDLYTALEFIKMIVLIGDARTRQKFFSGKRMDEGIFAARL